MKIRTKEFPSVVLVTRGNHRFISCISVRMTLIASKLGFSRKKSKVSFAKISGQNFVTLGN